MDRSSLDAVYIGEAEACASDRVSTEQAPGTTQRSDDVGFSSEAMSFLPALMRDPMHIIETSLSARDIIAFAQTNTLWRASLAKHEVIVGLRAMGRIEWAESALPDCVDIADAIGSGQVGSMLTLLAAIRIPHRLTFIREFAARMSRNPGAYSPAVTAMWKQALNDSALSATTEQNDVGAEQRDRIATELHAFVPFKNGSPWQRTVTRSCARAIANLPLRHQPDVLTVLAARVAPETLDSHLRRLLVRFDEWDTKPSPRILSSLATMMLFDISHDHVYATLCKKFALDPDVAWTYLEPLIARDFVRYFNAKVLPLRQVLNRWRSPPDTLGTVVHQRLLIESATCLRGCSTVLPDDESDFSVGHRSVRAFERVYGVSVDAAHRPDIDAAMLSFWDVYQNLTGSAGFGITRGWFDCRADIDRLPWVLQPTLMGRLVSEAYYLQWCGSTYRPIVLDVVAWEEKMVRQCLDHGYAVLAQRALMVQFNIHMCQWERWSQTEMSASLDRVFRIVQDHTPIATWGEWLESLCTIRAYALSNGAPSKNWMHEEPFQNCLKRFVCDSAAQIFAPSLLLRLALIRESVHFWKDLPPEADPSVTPFDGFCNRMDLPEVDRLSLQKRLSGGSRLQVHVGESDDTVSLYV